MLKPFCQNLKNKTKLNPQRNREGFIKACLKCKRLEGKPNPG